MPVITSTAQTQEVNDRAQSSDRVQSDDRAQSDDREDSEDGLVNDEHEEDAAGRVSSFVRIEPTKKQYKAIRSVHNSIAGHQGVESTLAKLK